MRPLTLGVERHVSLRRCVELHLRKRRLKPPAAVGEIAADLVERLQGRGNGVVVVDVEAGAQTGIRSSLGKARCIRATYRSLT